MGSFTSRELAITIQGNDPLVTCSAREYSCNEMRINFNAVFQIYCIYYLTRTAGQSTSEIAPLRRTVDDHPIYGFDRGTKRLLKKWRYRSYYNKKLFIYVSDTLAYFYCQSLFLSEVLLFLSN